MSPAIFDSAANVVLALLICGHLLADFVFQTEAMATGKRDSPAALVRHALEVTLVHAIVLLPAPGVLWMAAVLGGLHAASDLLKGGAERRVGSPLWLFYADQAVHLLAATGIWWVWRERTGGSVEFLAPFGDGAALGVVAALVGAYALNVNGGSAIVSGMLRGRKGSDPVEVPGGARTLGRGRAIGVLERMLMLTMVLVGQWGALGLVLAAKSIARFKELDDRTFGEYYLIGTLTSVLVAVVTGLALRLLLGF